MRKLFLFSALLIMIGAYGQAPTLADLRTGNVKIQTRVKQGTAYMLEPDVLSEYIKEQANVAGIVPPDTNYIFDAYGNGRFKGIMRSKYSFADSSIVNVIVDVVNGTDNYPETAYPTISFKSLTRAFEWIGKASTYRYAITIKNTNSGLKAALSPSAPLVISGKYIILTTNTANGTQYIEMSGSTVGLSNCTLFINGTMPANIVIEKNASEAQFIAFNSALIMANVTYNLSAASTNGLFSSHYSKASLMGCTINYTANAQGLFTSSRGSVLDIGQTANTFNVGAFTGLKLSNEVGGGRSIVLLSPLQAIPAVIGMGTNYVLQEGKAATPFLTYAQRMTLTNPYKGIVVAQSDSLQGEYIYDNGWKLKTPFGQNISLTAGDTGGGSASVAGDSRRGLITVSLGASTVAEGATIATLSLPTVNTGRQVVLQDVGDNVLVDGSANQMQGGYKLEANGNGKYFYLKVKSISPGTWTTPASTILKFSYIVYE